MANQWFQFKQFTVQQQLCAMKVGTDGVLLGAWACVDDVSSVLDIGTGTGLIALMIAQRNQKALIDAIDIDRQAYEQAAGNFKDSPWGERLNPIFSSLGAWCAKSDKTYDLIVCNPPYFINSLKSPDLTRNVARHNDSLPSGLLIESVLRLLSEKGRFAIVLPFDEFQDIRSGMEMIGLFMVRRMNVRPTPGKPVKRVLSEWGREPGLCVTTELIIEDKGRHGYSDAYRALIRDFYLNS